MINLHYTKNVATIHDIPVGLSDSVRVVGDPANASYEWVIVCNGDVHSHSDDGFGSPERALCSGLCAYLN